MKEFVISNGELYHYGIPGMRWGHKKGPKASSSQSKPKKQKKELTPEEKKARGKKIAAGVLIGVGAMAVTAAAVYATKKRKDAVSRAMTRMELKSMYKPKRAAHLPRHREAWNILQKANAQNKRGII